MNEEYEALAPNKSTFVTVVAIIFICLSGLSILSSIANIVFQVLLNHIPELNQGIQKQIDEGIFPPFAEYSFKYRTFLMTYGVALSLITLCSSIGLLKRMNWARIAFIIILSLSIVQRLLVFAAQFVMMPQLPDSSAANTPMMNTFLLTFRIIFLFITIGICILYGWIIKKLLSENIRREFQPEISANISLTS